MILILILIGSIAALLGSAVLSEWLASRRGVSMEKAHASASAKRRRFRKTAEPTTAQASMMILGDDESRSGCQVTRVSRSSLHASSTRAVGQGSQVSVEWGEDVFVGNVAVEEQQHSGYAVEIALVSSTYSRGGLFRTFARRFQS